METPSKKVLITAVIILMGAALVVPLSDTSPASAYQSSGIAIDFGKNSYLGRCGF